MVYSSKIGDIDLSKVTRLYPAVLIEVNGERAEMSLEWTEMNADKVTIISYILVFDFSAPTDELRNKTELQHKTQSELIETMTEVSQLFGD